MSLATPVSAPASVPGRATRLGSLVVPGAALLLSTVAIVVMSTAHLLH